LHQEEKILFSLLKKEIVATMMRSYPGIDPDISHWKGQNLTDFQEDLHIKVNGQLSEKWFYMHMKNENSSLPRVDVLNLLSQYAGYKNWQDFSHKMTGNLTEELKHSGPQNRLRMIFLSLIFVIILIFILIRVFYYRNYNFTFIDSDTREPILNNNLRVELISKDESPVHLTPDERGNVTVRTKKDQLIMVVKVPYYFTDTLIRTLRKSKVTEQISLKADYYALMITYFSNSDINSWEDRRKQLDKVISEDAIIYQFPGNRAGNIMSIYNKWEFIDKITMPSSGLRNLEILDCRYLEGKIAILRFRIMDEIK